MTKLSLEDSRKEIDRIDTEMFKLFEERMAVADNIAAVKFDKKLPILNSSREDEIISKAKKAVRSEYSAYAAEFCSHMMELSRSRQHEVMALLSKTETPIKKIIEKKKEEITCPRVAVQGVMGSYASIAARSMYKNGTLIFFDTWNEVMIAIADGKADYGVLPVENSTAGSVMDVYDLLLNYKYYIVKALRLPVSHCLLGVKDADINGIKEVFSHPHAFPQCRPFFDKNKGIKKVNCPNTAMAAKTVAMLGDKSKAAIASKECAEIYGLEILTDSVQQTDDNCTRFVSVSKEPEAHENADKISLIISLPHKTGSLYKLLYRFSLCGHNLTKIESRPDPTTPFEYYFYVDFIGSLSSEKTINLLSVLKDELPFLYYLGNYSETEKI